MISPELPLYPWLLGEDYSRLPAIVRQMHDVSPRVKAIGFGTVSHGNSRASRLVARWLRLPRAGVNRPLEVTFEVHDGIETLSRRYADATLTTHQSAAAPAGSGWLNESFGPLSLILQLQATADGLTFHLQDVRWRGWSLPRCLQPRLHAREFAAGGCYRFAVEVELPWLGRLIAYEGQLQPEPSRS